MAKQMNRSRITKGIVDGLNELSTAAPNRGRRMNVNMIDFYRLSAGLIALSNAFFDVAEVVVAAERGEPEHARCEVDSCCWHRMVYLRKSSLMFKFRGHTT